MDKKDNNAPSYGLAIDHARLAGNNWRTGRDNARKLARYLVTAAMVDGYALDPLIGEAKDAMKYKKLDKADQGGVRVFFTTIRNICENWQKLKQEQRDAFTAGSLLYSTLAADIKKAEAAAEKAEAEAAEAERLAELGIDKEAFEALQERETDAQANVAAIERIIAMLSDRETVRTESEQLAVMRLSEAVAAMETAIVQEAVAA